MLTSIIQMLIPGIIGRRLIDLSSTQGNKQAAHYKNRLSDRISLKDEFSSSEVLTEKATSCKKRILCSRDGHFKQK